MEKVHFENTKQTSAAGIKHLILALDIISPAVVRGLGNVIQLWIIRSAKTLPVSGAGPDPV